MYRFLNLTVLISLSLSYIFESSKSITWLVVGTVHVISDGTLIVFCLRLFPFGPGVTFLFMMFAISHGLIRSCAEFSTGSSNINSFT